MIHGSFLFATVHHRFILSSDSICPVHESIHIYYAKPKVCARKYSSAQQEIMRFAFSVTVGFGNKQKNRVVILGSAAMAAKPEKKTKKQE